MNYTHRRILFVEVTAGALRHQGRAPRMGSLENVGDGTVWDSVRVTGKWEFISSFIGLVPTDALVLIEI